MKNGTTLCCPADDSSYNPFMSNMVNLVIFAHTNHNQHHIALFTDKLIDHAQSGTAQLDLEESGQLCIVFVSQSFSISFLCIWQRIRSYFLDGFFD